MNLKKKIQTNADFITSQTIVIDGKDGAVLWNTTSGRYDVTSDLTVRTAARNRDMFLFRMQGRKGKDPRPQGAIHGATGIQRVVSDPITIGEYFKWKSEVATPTEVIFILSTVDKQ